MSNWSEIIGFDTIQYSDSTEISPNKQLCLNCCYQLEESGKSRNGSIMLIDISKKSAEIVANEVDIDGILDSCWTGSNSFILAGALGNIYEYRVNDRKWVRERQIEIDNNSLCLSVDFHAKKMICSTSRGEIVILNESGNAIFRDCIHSYEAWVSHLSRHDENVFYTGGDDCKFIGFDFRSGTKLFTKTFDMGCTSIQSHPILPNIVSSGSYDETLKIWDLRTMRVPVESIDVGGGVWRHKWCPKGKDTVLVAGMYGGFAVLRTGGQEQPLIRPDGTSHASGGLAYGADWICEGDVYWITGCSFYDHRWSLSRLS